MLGVVVSLSMSHLSWSLHVFKYVLFCFGPKQGLFSKCSSFLDSSGERLQLHGKHFCTISRKSQVFFYLLCWCDFILFSVFVFYCYSIVPEEKTDRSFFLLIQFCFLVVVVLLFFFFYIYNCLFRA